MECTVTRQETEERIILALEKIWDEYMKYNPNGNYLDFAILRRGNVVFFHGNNRCWPEGEDIDFPLDFRMYAGELQEG